MKYSWHDQTLLLAIVFPATIAITLFSDPAFGEDGAEGPFLTHQENTLSEWRVSQQLAVINSWDSLDQYIARNGIDKTPFGALSRSGVNAFLDNLEFTELGVSTLNHSVLQAELSVSEAYRILKLFGVESLITEFEGLRVETAMDREILEAEHSVNSCPCIPNAKCVPPATCSKESNSCCVTCNCGMQTP